MILATIVRDGQRFLVERPPIFRVRPIGVRLPSPTRELLTPCVHTWNTAEYDHEHRCNGLPGCHDAPCRCRCGALDYCTKNPSTVGLIHDPKKPKAMA